jgi:(p)ppGpp synthase/HD superfamily hydrolase
MDEKQELLARIDEIFSVDDRKDIREALKVAEACHKGQKRDEGTPYILHPIRVGLILLNELGVNDPVPVIIALLHDVMEDSDITEAEIESRFGTKVAHAVKVLTKKKDYGLSKEERDRLYIENLSEADPVIRRIKLSDRLDNVRGLHRSPDPGKRRKYWQETRDVYLPFARTSGEDYIYEALSKWCSEFLRG